MTNAPTQPAAVDVARQVFQARGLTKVYGTGTAEVRALDGVNLDLPEGELVVLLGPSGSGKTTLLNMLGGLDIPTDGTLLYRDFNLAEAGEEERTLYRREHVGFVFQFYNLIPSLTARENVALITEIAPDPMSPEEALGLVQLKGRLDHFPAQLSGGEQQRVAGWRSPAPSPSDRPCSCATSRPGPSMSGRELRCWKRSSRSTANSAPSRSSSPTMP